MKQLKAKAANPSLRFSPTAWAKLVYLRDLGPSEVGGFGVTPVDDLLYVEDVVLVKQICNPMSVVFDDASVADFFEVQIERGLRPEQFARVWIHTHPGDSPVPSGTDEETFARVFGECNWAVMFILAESGQTYARLGFHTGPGGAIKLAVDVDFSLPFAASDPEGWEEEYLANVTVDEPLFSSRFKPLTSTAVAVGEDFWRDEPWDTRWTIVDERLLEKEAMHE
jgi:proteasome lid subunit RPN8/RPN11